MPIRIKNGLPVKEKLERENLFVIDERRAIDQDIRPLEICILNLMPTKEETELQLLRMLSNTPLQLNITFMRMSSHQSANVAASHLNNFYYSFRTLKKRTFDGLIITGAPVEKMEYEEVDYWSELCEVFEWSKSNVTSTFHICWGAQAGLYYHYGLPKKLLDKKLFGVYSHKVRHRKEPIVRGFDDYFLIPHSRYTEVPAKAIHACKELKILAESPEAGILLCMSRDGRRFFIMGHPEYDRNTLRDEYNRDVRKGLDINVPLNYFPDDDPTQRPLLQWRSHSNNLYCNWINYYVYQATPYDLNEISEKAWEWKPKNRDGEKEAMRNNRPRVFDNRSACFAARSFLSHTWGSDQMSARLCVRARPSAQPLDRTFTVKKIAGSLCEKSAIFFCLFLCPFLMPLLCLRDQILGHYV